MRTLLITAFASASLIAAVSLAQAQQAPEARPSTTMDKGGGSSGLDEKGTQGFGNPPYVRQRPIMGRSAFEGQHHLRSRHWSHGHWVYR